MYYCSLKVAEEGVVWVERDEWSKELQKAERGGHCQSEAPVLTFLSRASFIPIRKPHLPISTPFLISQEPFPPQLLGSLAPSHPNHWLPSTFCSCRRCNTCPYTTSLDFNQGPQQSFQVGLGFTCTSSNLIYCIWCSQCGPLYIGKTKRWLGDHFAEHLCLLHLGLRDIPVSNHLNSPSLS